MRMISLLVAAVRDDTGKNGAAVVVDQSWHVSFKPIKQSRRIIQCLYNRGQDEPLAENVSPAARRLADD
jgi:hypothetical protein